MIDSSNAVQRFTPGRIAALLAISTFLLYCRAIRFDSLDYDDSSYFFTNPYLRLDVGWAGFHWALTTFYCSNWHPVVWFTYLVDFAIFGDRVAPLYIINIALHAISSALLFLVLLKLTGCRGRSVLVAIIFAWHPQRLESVVWISETKDDLATLFWMLTMLAYLRYIRRVGWLRYIPVILLFSLAVASKQSAITLPIVLLLLDIWVLPRRGYFQIFFEKLPLFACSIAASLLCIEAQKKGGALVLSRYISSSMRIKNALVSIGNYALKTIWPTHLSILYPHPALVGLAIPGWKIAAALAFIVVASVAMFVRRRRVPMAWVGWMWFLVVLGPMLGLVQVGEQSMADRYSYLSCIGLLIAVVWSASETPPIFNSPSETWQRIRGGGLAVVCIALAIGTEIQLSYWRNTQTLFNHADKVTNRNYMAKAMLSYWADADGNTDQAISLAREAVEICPLVPTTFHALGSALNKAGRLTEALAAYNRSLQIDPTQAIVYNEKGTLLLDADDFDGAEAAFEQAIQIDRFYAAARHNEGIVLAHKGKYKQAIDQWRAAVMLDPKFGATHGWLATALERRGDRAGAISEFRAAVRLGEHRTPWLTDFAWLLATDPHSNPADVAEALGTAEQANAQTSAPDPLILDALAAAQARSGRFDDAVTTAQQAAAWAVAANQPNLASAIQTRIMKYHAGQPYIAER